MVWTFPDSCEPRCRCQACQQRCGEMYIKRSYVSVLTRIANRRIEGMRDAAAARSVVEELNNRFADRVNAEIAKSPLN